MIYDEYEDFDAVDYDEGTYRSRTQVRDAQSRAEVLRARARRLAADAEERAERLMREAERLDQMPAEPQSRPGEPAIVYFRKQFHEGGRVYDYVAIRAGSEDLWYTSGPKSPKGYTWEQLLGFIYPDGTELEDVALWQVTDMAMI